MVRDDKVLLIQENHLPDKGKWNIPAGRLDLGENPIDAVKREVFEEAGLAFKPTAILGIHSVYRQDLPDNDGGTHCLRLMFTGDVSGTVSLENGETKEGIPEIAASRWVTVDELLALDDAVLRYHDIKALARDYRSGVNYPLAIIEHFIQTET